MDRVFNIHEAKTSLSRLIAKGDLAADSLLFMRAASWWELAINNVLGRLRFNLRATRKALEIRGQQVCPVTVQRAEAAAALNRLQGDLFDHMLVAQAIAEALF